MDKWNDVLLVPEFSGLGVDCYKLQGGNYRNEYYVVSEAKTRKLLSTPEVVGYEVYDCLVHSTSQMMYYFKQQDKVHKANILTILRGALNYPLEESCWREHIRVHDISFLSSERVFDGSEIAGLEMKYSKLAAVPDSTLLIGDIIASGATLVHCLRHVTDYYRKAGVQFRNVIVFTVGSTTGIRILEQLTKEIRTYWPAFEGFQCVFYEGIFANWTDGGVTGVQVPDVDFYWKGGIISPEYRREILSARNPLFEKCTIYDGGARRYGIEDHIREVLEYWNALREKSDAIDMKALIDERLGYETPASYEDWLAVNHYGALAEKNARWLYSLEQGFAAAMKNVSIGEIAAERIEEFTAALNKYMA